MNSANKIVVLLTAATLLGCSADDAAPGSETARRAIAFAATDGTPTRTAPGTLTTTGEGTGEVSLQAVGFGVFACHTGLHPYVGSDVTPNYMWNQRVSYTKDGVWDYTPLVYWPAPVEGLQPYVSFFAYAPYAASPGTGTTAADRCIVDMSRSVESGDPWLVYQLGGTEDNWQDNQVDLLYDFQPDQQQGDVQDRVKFQFRHALASAGDVITVGCGTGLIQQLQQDYADTDITVTLDRVELVYTLLRKGRLWLNSSDKPRWEAVSSESPTVQRRLTLQPDDEAICTVKSATKYESEEYTATNQGIFYIPLTVAGITQQVDISVTYHTSLAPGTSRRFEATVDLTPGAKAGGDRSIRIVLPKSED